MKGLSKEQQIAEEQPLLNDRYSLPVVKKESFHPIEVIRTPKNETILDFGQNLTGWVEFDSALAEGEEIILSAAEILQDGCFTGKLSVSRSGVPFHLRWKEAPCETSFYLLRFPLYEGGICG